jgi:hypothetical protein
VKLFVARFWSDIKEWEAVCVNYFCAVVPFWELGDDVGAGLTGARERKFLYVLDSKPEPFKARRVRHPREFKSCLD